MVPLTPVDTSSTLILHTDTSTDGVGWVMSQIRSNDNNFDVYNSSYFIIAMGSSTLPPSQKRYSPVELKVLAISHSIQKLDFYTRYANLVRVYTDCSALTSIPGTRNYMTDYLSRYSWARKILQMLRFLGHMLLLGDYEQMRWG